MPTSPMNPAAGNGGPRPFAPPLPSAKIVAPAPAPRRAAPVPDVAVSASVARPAPPEARSLERATVAARDRQLVLATPGGPPDLGPALRRRLDGRSEALVRRAQDVGAPITYLGIGHMPERPRLYPGADTDWALVRLEDDPLFRRGDFPIPRTQRRHLERLVANGIEMDDLLVAHEVPASDVRSKLPALDRTGPQEIPVERLSSLIEHPGPAASTQEFTHRAGRIAEGTSKLAVGAFGAAAAAAIAPVALVAAVGAGLDPVVFGVRRVPGHRHVVQIYELVRWDW